MSQDTIEFFHKDYQRGLVANTLRTPDLLQSLHQGKFSEEDFGNPLHKAFILCALKVLELQKGFDPEVLIPAETLSTPLKVMIAAGEIFQEEIPVLKDEFEMIYTLDLNPRFYIETLPQFLSELRFKKTIKSYKGGDPRVVLAEAQRIISSIDGGHEEERVIHPLLVPQMATEAVQVVPCGINAIDSRMNGGLGKKELGIICGISGLGKTTLAVNFCWGAAMRGHKAALITLELPGKKISERLYSRITGIQYDRIRFGDEGNMDAVNAEVWQKVGETSQNARENFSIWDFSDKPVSLRTLEAKLEKLANEGELPDMVFLDWLDALGSDPTERKGGYVPRELRHLLQSYSEGCSNLAKKFNIALWATTQSNAKGDNERRLRMTNASEGFSKAWRCSVFLGMGATDEDRTDGNVITVSAGKMRDGQLFCSEIRARLDVQTFEDIDAQQDILNSNPNFRPLNQLA